jgi:outer membrane receptor for ferrienterochelin and colicins
MRTRFLLLVALTLLGGTLTAARAQTAAADTDPTARPDTLKAIELQQLVVTGTRSERLLAETPVRTELVTRRDMAAFGARSLAEAVEFTPGLRVLNSCQNCNFTELSMLGLEGKYTQVLFDSQPVFSGLAMVYGLEQIPTRLIERIEIIKGGGSALYGPGAVAGVVNVIPRLPLDSGVSASVQYDDMDGSPGWSAGFSADVVSRDGRTATTVYGQGERLEPYDRDGDGFTEIGRRMSNAMGLRVLRETARAGRVTLDFSRIFEDRRGGDQLDLPPFRSEVAEWIRTWRNALSVGWRQPWSESLETQATVAYAHTERSSYYGGGDDQAALDAYGETWNPMWVTDLQVNHHLRRNVLTWGLQFSHEDLSDEYPGYDRIIDERYTNLGLYVQDDWAVTDRTALVTGLRLDKHSELDKAVLSPRVALRHEFSRDVSLRAAFSQGFLAPQIFDEDLHLGIVGGEAQIIFNDPDLKEERSTSFSLGLEATPPVAGGFGRFELNAFRTDLRDAFVLTFDRDDPDTPELELFRINGGDAHVQGIEATVGWLGGRFEGQLGWVLQKGEYDEPQDFGETGFFRLPGSYGVMRAYWRDRRLVDLFVGLRYLGSEKVPHYAGWIDEDRLETTRAFWVLDLSLSRRLPLGDDSLTVTLGVRNLTDAYQEDLDQGPERDTTYIYGPRYPRTFFASLGYDF